MRQETLCCPPCEPGELQIQTQDQAKAQGQPQAQDQGKVRNQGKLRDQAQTAIQDSDAEFARLAAALGHPARVAIIRFLKAKGVCICGEIVEVLPLAQSTVSQHLKTLKEAGLVQGETDGPRSCYCLNPAALERLRSLLGDL